jgi:hypothetical protein
MGKIKKWGGIGLATSGVWNDRCGTRLPDARRGLWKVSGKVETDKWPLEELARLRGRATSAHRVRRGRVSFDG